MKKTLIYLVVSTLFLFALVEPIFASDLRWLNYSPVRFFTDQDWDLAKEAGRKALNKTEDGDAVKWANPKSSSHGSLTPLSTSSVGGKKCRMLKIENYANNLQGSSIYKFCQKGDGKWGAVNSPAAQ